MPSAHALSSVEPVFAVGAAPVSLKSPSKSFVLDCSRRNRTRACSLSTIPTAPVRSGPQFVCCRFLLIQVRRCFRSDDGDYCCTTMIHLTNVSVSSPLNSVPSVVHNHRASALTLRHFTNRHDASGKLVQRPTMRGGSHCG